jgi:transposase-like protein
MLDERQLKCIERLMKGNSIADIAKELNVSRQTIYNWKEAEEFKAELDRVGQELLSSAMYKLKRAAPVAADKLIDLLTKGKYEKTKLSAAIDILDRNLGKATTKLEVNDGRDDKKKLNDDILEQEFNEVDNKED